MRVWLVLALFLAALSASGQSAFRATGGMTVARAYRSATLLNNGQVLIAGGEPACDYTTPYTKTIATAELYNPARGTFIPTGSMITARRQHAASLLPNGSVLIAGGFTSDGYQGSYVNTAKIYDPSTGTFRAAGTMIHDEGFLGSLLLGNGKVLLGGSHAELYDATTESFADAGLYAGYALIASGAFYGNLTTRATDLYDLVRGTFRAGPDMITTRTYHSATLLNDGRVLVAGGNTGPLTAASLAEVYNPDVLQTAPTRLFAPGAEPGQGAILHAGAAGLVSASDPAVAGEALEIYCTGLAEGSVIPPSVAISGKLASVLYFGKAPGFPGLNQVNVRVPGGATPGSAVPMQLNYLGRPSNMVTIGVN
jgi:Galactose oxidase, central domain